MIITMVGLGLCLVGGIHIPMTLRYEECLFSLIFHKFSFNVVNVNIHLKH